MNVVRPAPGRIQDRKSEHLAIARDCDVEPGSRDAGPFDAVQLEHQALPELDLDDVDPGVRVLGRTLTSPFLIGSMTGGTAEAASVNRILAGVAQEHGFGMCLGSQRAMIENPTLGETYDVRAVAPDILLIANVGAVQLRKGISASQIEDAARRVDADALVFHLNAAQEAVQEGGDTCFAGLAERIVAAASQINMPCGVKEVGSGFSRRSAARLADPAVAFFESAGRGGTSWPLIEGLRANGPVAARVGATFAQWGVDSMASLQNCLAAAHGRPVIASGGVRTGLDAARAVAAGATAVAVALPFLRAASAGEARCRIEAQCFDRELRTAMFLVGTPDLPSLRCVGGVR